MKFLITLLACLLCISAWAETDPNIAYSPIQNEFAPLDELEKYVQQTEASLADMQQSNPSMVTNLNMSDQSVANVNDSGDLPLVGPFWWGCCLGPIGLIVVYLVTDNDKEDVKNALVGCIISVLLFGLGAFWNPFAWW